MNLSKLLIIEDDRNIAVALAHALRNDYRVELASTGKQGLYKCDSEHYDIIVLDLNLPDLAGFAVCQQLRERGATMPILILTAENAVLTKVSLLDAGADASPSHLVWVS